eukprot:6449153-Pyramimonas_sp.AAC.1
MRPPLMPTSALQATQEFGIRSKLPSPGKVVTLRYFLVKRPTPADGRPDSSWRQGVSAACQANRAA